jgi:predicted transcriptional regulator
MTAPQQYTIHEYAEKVGVTSNTIRNRIMRSQADPVDMIKNKNGSITYIYSIIDLKACMKKKEPIEITNPMCKFLSVPLNPVGKWYGFNT